VGIFRYPGGKSRLLKPIKETLYPLLDKAGVYVEPFVGGGSVLIQVAKDFPHAKLVVNDKDERIFCFWSLFQHGNEDQIKSFYKLVKQKPTVKLFKQLREDGVENRFDPVEQAYHAIFFNRCTFSGIATSGPIGGYEQKGKYKVDCRYNPDRIISDFEKLRDLFMGRVYVSNLKAVDLMEIYDIHKEKAMYLDPPYYVKGSGLYPVHMKPDEHVELSRYLKTKDNWLLSYDICDEIDEMYEWADKIPLDARYSINGENRKDWVPKKEYLIRPYAKK